MTTTCGLKLIVGLGNPGSEYKDTRHNAGFWWLDELWQSCQVSAKAKSSFRGNYASCQLEGNKLHTLAPTTFMNDAGIAVRAIADFYKIAANDILVVHDELDLEPGICRVKFSGGHAGHNGLRSIISHLKTKDFYRLRLGIGHPGHKDRVSPYVLNKPSKIEHNQINDAITNSLYLLPQMLAGNWEQVMQSLHS